MTDRESRIEAADRKIAQLAGWFVEKIMRCGRRGFPDRLYARAKPQDVCPHCGRGRVVLIEWKKPGKDAERLQAIRHAELRAAGVEVYTCDDVDEARMIRGD